MKLEIGYNHSFEVRREPYLADCNDEFSILYLSDLHLNRFSGNTIAKITGTMNKLHPSIVLLGGDYVDSAQGVIHLHSLLNGIADQRKVFAVAGNHDYRFGLEKIQKIMTAYNVIWIEKDSHTFRWNNTTIHIDGNIITAAKTKSDFSILLLHKPLHVRHFQNNYNLAVAGHLHGCQVILWKSGNKLFPGRFFYKWNILQTTSNTCRYLVSKGLGDTLPIRYNCKKDMLFIEVVNNIH